MLLTSDTLLIVQYPGSHIPDVEMTWAEFVFDNDEDIVADVRDQITVNNYAAIGGGASPLVWIFA
jgi:hypothetical protein